MSLIGAVLAYFFLDGTLRVVVIVALLLSDVFEITIWLRWRKKKAMTGPDGMIGRKGTAISECRPEGRVKVMGQIWNASCLTGAEAGDEIEVTGVDGLRLHVVRR
ncbi:MAG: hypothetical protein M3N53_04525 [Actinomycetota bacterium]|nr:hypothetical protein [Actinomycetota bacterium]